jgi:hypothetical protein
MTGRQKRKLNTVLFLLEKNDDEEKEMGQVKIIERVLEQLLSMKKISSHCDDDPALNAMSREYKNYVDKFETRVENLTCLALASEHKIKNDSFQRKQLVAILKIKLEQFRAQELTPTLRFDERNMVPVACLSQEEHEQILEQIIEGVIVIGKNTIKTKELVVDASWTKKILFLILVFFFSSVLLLIGF